MTTAEVFKAAEKHFKVDFSVPAKDFFSTETRAKEMAILYAMTELKSTYEDIMDVLPELDRTTISLLKSFGKGNLQSNVYLREYNSFKQTIN